MVNVFKLKNRSNGSDTNGVRKLAHLTFVVDFESVIPYLRIWDSAWFRVAFLHMIRKALANLNASTRTFPENKNQKINMPHFSS